MLKRSGSSSHRTYASGHTQTVSVRTFRRAVGLEACSRCRRLDGDHRASAPNGLALVIDYGYDVRELARLPEGTLLSYRSHRAEPVTLGDAGDEDITAHVNFSWLTDAAEANDFVRVTNMSLARWAMSIWDEEVFSDEVGPSRRTDGDCSGSNLYSA